jgi:hypothetical protein
VTIATDDNLNEIAREARAAKTRGERTIDFQIEATCGAALQVNLWEDMTGRVIGRVFEDSQEPVVPGIPQGRRVKYFTVRANVIDICEAQRRRMEREAAQFGAQRRDK